MSDIPSYEEMFHPTHTPGRWEVFLDSCEPGVVVEADLKSTDIVENARIALSSAANRRGLTRKDYKTRVIDGRLFFVLVKK